MTTIDTGLLHLHNRTSDTGVAEGMIEYGKYSGENVRIIKNWALLIFVPIFF